MKRTWLAAVFAISALLALGASPLSVSWIDGKVEAKSGSSWRLLSVGDMVDSQDTVRLGAGAVAEFSDGKRKVAITAAGMFPLESLLKGGADATKKRSATVDKLGRLVDPNARASQTAVAGVRGAAVEPAGETITWASEGPDPDVLMDEARALARDGRFAEASHKFSEAADAAEGEQKDGALYGKAWALAAADSVVPAVMTLRTIPASGPWAGPRALLLARLDLESGAVEEARSVLKTAIDAKLLVGDDLALAKSMLEEAGK